MVAWSRCEPLPAGRTASAIEIKRNPDDLEVAEYLPLGLLLDLVDETIHRLSDAGKVAAKPLTVESGRHRLVLPGADVDDPRHVADAAVVVRPVDHRNELVVRVLAVLGVLAKLVAVVLLAVEEGDDERVLEPDIERVRAISHLAGAGSEVISKQGPAARGVDEDVSGLEHRHPLLGRHDGRCALDPVQPARIDQIADGALDGVERAEPQRPTPQECTEVRRNRLPEREALLEL